MWPDIDSSAERTSALISVYDISHEHLLGEGLRQADIDLFRSADVPPRAMFRSAYGWSAIILRDRIVDNEERFKFARHHPDAVAQWAFTIPCFDSFGDLADIVAWRPPHAAATWLGRVSMLGEEQVLGPRLDEPLRVHSTIMAWFRAERTGVVIVDPARAAGLLHDAGSLLVDEVAFGQRLRTALTVAAPNILVADREAVAA